MSSFAAIPEELVERILSLCLVTPLSPPHRPPWHSWSPSQTASVSPRLAPLLVCRSFNRIATPLLYHTLHLPTELQIVLLLASPSFDPAHVRRIMLTGVSAHGAILLRRCSPTLRVLDLTLDIAAARIALCEFSAALGHLKRLSHLTLRKPVGVYLTHPKPRHVIYGLANAIKEWEALESAHIAFRLFDDSITLNHPIPAPTAGPITALTISLRDAPHLHTFTTMLPSAWSDAILRVSGNPQLERIVLGEGVPGDADADRPNFDSNSNAVVGTGLFLMQARKHQRLCELIKAGTSIIRTRAHTMGTTLVSPTSSRSSSVEVTSSRASSSSPYADAGSSASSSSATQRLPSPPLASTSHRSKTCPSSPSPSAPPRARFVSSPPS